MLVQRRQNVTGCLPFGLDALGMWNNLLLLTVGADDPTDGVVYALATEYPMSTP